MSFVTYWCRLNILRAAQGRSGLSVYMAITAAPIDARIHGP